MKNCIVLTGGGTAGHVMPHFALLDSLKQNYSKIVYIGSKNGVEKEIVKNKANLDFYGIDAVKFVRGKILVNLLLPVKLIKAKHQAKKYLKATKPNVIFSKGGFVSVPVVLAAKSLKIPVVCHESDLSMGLANKICSKYAKCVCTTFEKTSHLKSNNGVFTGTPLISQAKNLDAINQTKKRLGILPNLKVLLVTGGSLGSVAINKAVFSAINTLTKNYYVIHITGKGNKNNNLNLKNYTQIEFASNMPELIDIADIVVSRAGSNTIFELAHALKPMLLIPLPKGASRGDQVENANYFKDNHFANVLYQENLSPTTLVEMINSTNKDKANLIKHLKNSGFKNGTKQVLEQIYKYSL